jgi:hypothetical protein
MSIEVKVFLMLQNTLPIRTQIILVIISTEITPTVEEQNKGEVGKLDVNTAAWPTLTRISDNAEPNDEFTYSVQ